MPETITIQAAQYALDLVKKICREVGPGLPGRHQSHSLDSLPDAPTDDRLLSPEVG